jgi:hypothetical protein
LIPLCGLVSETSTFIYVVKREKNRPSEKMNSLSLSLSCSDPLPLPSLQITNRGLYRVCV